MTDKEYIVLLEEYINFQDKMIKSLSVDKDRRIQYYRDFLKTKSKYQMSMFRHQTKHKLKRD